jgi:hypothetical protein
MSILSEDSTLFGFEDRTMDIHEFFASNGDDLLSGGLDGFAMDSYSLLNSPPELRRSMSSTSTSHYFHTSTGEEESGPEGDDLQQGRDASSQLSTEDSDDGWTKEDTLRLTELVKFYGHNWVEVAKSFDGQTHSPEVGLLPSFPHLIINLFLSIEFDLVCLSTSAGSLPCWLCASNRTASNSTRSSSIMSRSRTSFSCSRPPTSPTRRCRPRPPASFTSRVPITVASIRTSCKHWTTARS